MSYSQRWTWKKYLAFKLADFPLLRILLLHFWFRLAFAFAGAVLCSLALLLPKIWKVTPPGVRPEIKISGLDAIQAWSLERTATRLAAAGKTEEANFTWQTAIANNPADPKLLRGFIQNLINEPSEAYQASGAQICFWLVQLTRTNRFDVELAARFFEAAEQDEMLDRLLEGVADRSPELELARAKLLFRQGAIAKFAQHATKLSGSNDPAWQLYRSAFEFGWGGPSRKENGRVMLERAFRNSTLPRVARRLHLLACAQLNDVEGYERSLRALAETHDDRATEHAAYWRLLVRNGRFQEAASAAESHSGTCRSPAEALQLANAFEELQLHSATGKTLRSACRQFSSSPQIFLSYSRFLESEKSWEELRRAAIEMRQKPALRQTLLGASYFFEGEAEFHESRPRTAEKLFREAGEHAATAPPVLALRVAQGLLWMGYPESARQFLEPQRIALAQSAMFWSALFSTALPLRDHSLLLEAGRRWFELDPANAAAASNYAVALLVNREDPSRAMQLTFEFQLKHPELAAARINHALALILNNRPAEAQALLDEVSPEQLNPAEANAYQLARFELFWNGRQYSEAESAARRLNPKFLFPNQAERIELCRRQIAAR